MVNHCNGPCCVRKSFLNPSAWTWEFDTLGSNHRRGCVQQIVATNRVVKLTGSTADVNHQSHQCELKMVQHYTICGRRESLTKFPTNIIIHHLTQKQDALILLLNWYWGSIARRHNKWDMLNQWCCILCKLETIRCSQNCVHTAEKQKCFNL